MKVFAIGRVQLLATAALASVLGCSHPAAPVPAVDPSPTPRPVEPAAPEQNEPAAQPPTRVQCDAVPGWRFERIALPPAFAPTLPAGTEILWFAPGMFDPEADDYFTYAFSLAFDDDQALEPQHVAAWLTDYYAGLMNAVAKSRNTTPKRDATVDMRSTNGAGSVTLSDEFTTGSTITVSLRLSTDGPCLRVLATARPSDSNWQQLERAHACLCGLFDDAQ